MPFQSAVKIFFACILISQLFACEYNIQPPNPVSKRFHDKFGFKELDTQWVANGTKKVTLQAAEVQRITQINSRDLVL